MKMVPKKKNFCYTIILVALFNSALLTAQIVDFSIPSNACLEETLITSNGSSGFNGYLWDFCGAEFQSEPIEETM